MTIIEYVEKNYHFTAHENHLVTFIRAEIEDYVHSSGDYEPHIFEGMDLTDFGMLKETLLQAIPKLIRTVQTEFPIEDSRIKNAIPAIVENYVKCLAIDALQYLIDETQKLKIPNING